MIPKKQKPQRQPRAGDRAQHWGTPHSSASAAEDAACLYKGLHVAPCPLH